jgi:hypothetical protein
MPGELILTARYRLCGQIAIPAGTPAEARVTADILLPALDCFWRRRIE